MRGDVMENHDAQTPLRGRGSAFESNKVAPVNEILLEAPKPEGGPVRVVPPQSLILGQTMENQLAIVRGLNKVIEALNEMRGDDGKVIDRVRIFVSQQARSQTWQDALADEWSEQERG